ncbi:uncharacterized protein BDZ99DRAFT_462164 [Mytilinidion resinicola]|uniref:BZIP domain-containing protein n=1 Tax=Mytilinidion resinicola TaxID=574789 RepID=A0A6A6YS41_9PEZI|nr:uncharacterized protein BDZ99DRAFT_462164 [Mytilinidion resinicola]KAF2810864.1 hypothetical protein BDZ99DRAFT_462164 [Mytilinidion resinicola]
MSDPTVQHAAYINQHPLGLNISAEHSFEHDRLMKPSLSGGRVYEATENGSTGSTKKPGRSVLRLTPTQLERKRARDREAQRTMRERAKNVIESLEKLIMELKKENQWLKQENHILKKNGCLLQELDKRDRSNLPSVDGPKIKNESGGHLFSTNSSQGLPHVPLFIGNP